MRKLDESGSLVLPFVIVFIVMLTSIGFGAWAYMGRQDYKNKSDEKSAAAVKVAVAAESVRKDKEFAEIEKSPLKTFQGTETFGSIGFQYPKTWSAYVIVNDKGTTPVDGFFHPNYVPSTTGDTAFALRIQVVNTSYSEVLKTFDATTKSGKVKVSAFRAAKVTTELGSKVEGEIIQKKQGTLILLPLRDKTIKIWTENSEFAADFNNTILPSLTFIP